MQIRFLDDPTSSSNYVMNVPLVGLAILDEKIGDSQYISMCIWAIIWRYISKCNDTKV